MIILGLNSFKELNINKTSENFINENNFEYLKFVCPDKISDRNSEDLSFTLRIFDLSKGYYNISEKEIKSVEILPNEKIPLTNELTEYSRLGFSVEIKAAASLSAGHFGESVSEYVTAGEFGEKIPDISADFLGKTNLVALRITNNLDLNATQSDSGSTGGGADIDTSNFATKSDLAKVNQRIDEIEISIPEISAEQTETGGTVTVGDKEIILTNGTDGFSPTIEVSETENGHQVNITDVNGLKQFEVLNGQNGADGQNGSDYILTEQDKQDIAGLAIENSEQWELINSAVVEEDVTSFLIDKDTEGNSFDLKELILKIKFTYSPAYEGTLNAVRLNGFSPTFWVEISNLPEKEGYIKYVYIYLRVVNGEIVPVTLMSSDNNVPASWGYFTSSSKTGVRFSTKNVNIPIKRIFLQSNLALIATGTEIEIHGVRK